MYQWYQQQFESLIKQKQYNQNQNCPPNSFRKLQKLTPVKYATYTYIITIAAFYQEKVKSLTKRLKMNVCLQCMHVYLQCMDIQKYRIYIHEYNYEAQIFVYQPSMTLLANLNFLQCMHMQLQYTDIQLLL
eukprot:TRINITY_DN10792_c0_g2_i2.p4 TRINITY_DN10792_c0_g2~~TRINITY_DN10792_c0_g2_i2.p4  ORF type:complete len:131 (+),score=0.62 TRINITY_DN10792_c0_g2_i2:234-626(+)